MKITKQRLKEIIKEELQNLEEVDRGEWVVQRSGVSYDEMFLNRGLKWGPIDRADVHEFKQEAQGTLRYALENGKIDSGHVIEKSRVDLSEVRAPFPTGSRVKHEDYGEGVVTHAGTKNTNVAVKFDNESRDGKKNRQVSRGSLKRAE